MNKTFVASCAAILLLSACSNTSNYQATERASYELGVVKAHCENAALTGTSTPAPYRPPTAYNATVTNVYNPSQSYNVNVQPQNTVAQGGAALGAAIGHRIKQQRIFDNCMVVNGYNKQKR